MGISPKKEEGKVISRGNSPSEDSSPVLHHLNTRILTLSQAVSTHTRYPYIISTKGFFEHGRSLPESSSNNTLHERLNFPKMLSPHITPVMLFMECSHLPRESMFHLLEPQWNFFTASTTIKCGISIYLAPEMLTLGTSRHTMRKPMQPHVGGQETTSTTTHIREQILNDFSLQLLSYPSLQAVTAEMVKNRDKQCLSALPNCRFMSKINDCCCFKPLNL